MKTTLYLDGKKVTRKRAIELIGKERLERHIKEAVELLMEDPGIDNGVWLGHGIGILNIEFTA